MLQIDRVTVLVLFDEVEQLSRGLPQLPDQQGDVVIGKGGSAVYRHHVPVGALRLEEPVVDGRELDLKLGLINVSHFILKQCQVVDSWLFRAFLSCLGKIVIDVYCFI